jgi:4-hydroxybenzoate polyprenyltransferase
MPKLNSSDWYDNTDNILSKDWDLLKAVASTVLSWVKYTSVWSITALVWSSAIYRVMNLPYDPLVLGIICILTFISYNHDHLANYSGQDDQSNTKQRSEWISVHYRQLQVLLLIAAMLMLILLALRPSALMPSLAIIGLSLGYNIRFLPGGYLIRQLPGIKAFYVGLGSTLCTIGIPVMVVDIPWDNHTILVMSAFFCFYTAIANVFDIRDIEGDRLVGTKTLAVLLGENQARLISAMLSVLGGSIAFLGGSLSLILVAIYLTTLSLTYRLLVSRIATASISIFGIICLASVIWIG